jgi:hypothetical protein
LLAIFDSAEKKLSQYEFQEVLRIWWAEGRELKGITIFASSRENYST